MMSNLSFFGAAVVVFVTLILDSKADPSAKGFYENDANVVNLNNKNFAQVLRGADTAYLVEFYMSWCGHCRRFAPIYRRFSNSVAGWKPLVKVAAINCAADDAKATCQAQGIRGVPTLKFFSAQTDEKAGKDFPSFRSVTKLKTELLQRVVDEDSVSPVVDFRPLEENDQRIMNMGDNLVALVVDDTNSTIPFELMLELHQHPHLSVFRVYPDHSWLSKIEIDDIPSIIFFRNGQPVDQAGFKDVLRSAILEYVDGVVSTHAPGWVTPRPPMQNVTKPSPITDKQMFFVSENDMLMAVRETLEDEVPFRGGVLTSDQIIALENYLEILKEYFPTQSLVSAGPNGGFVPRIQNLMNSRRAVKLFGYLLRWLKMERSLGNTVSTAKWSTILTTLKNSHGDPFPKGEWEHCKGSSENYRGYTCGLWSVFHAVTVKSYIKNRNNPEWDPRQPMNAIRGYVDSFFGCTYCREHFLKMSENMTEEIKTKEDSFLWMWQAHNQVNARLAGDPTEDPAFPKRQFPPSFLCSTCKASDGAWNTHETAKFILQYYSTIRPINVA